ncbi:hypothetical protein D3C85_1600820 [compost metagenome]
MLAFVELVDRLGALEVAADQDARLLELRQDAVDRGQTDVRTLVEQHAKDIFGRHVALRALLEDLQDLQAGQGGLEARAFEFVDIRHDRVFLECLRAYPVPVLHRQQKWPSHRGCGECRVLEGPAATMI